MGKKSSKVLRLTAIALGVAIGVSGWQLIHTVLAKAGVLESIDGYFKNARLTRELQSHALITPSQSEYGIRPEALVLLTNLAVKDDGVVAKGPSVGFVIGDGSLLLTAAHCLDFPDEKDRHGPMSREVVVISPFYGDVFEAAIVVMDRQSDLAVLRPSWKWHPALSLGRSQDLSQIKEVYAATRSFNEEDFLSPSRRTAKSPWVIECPARIERIVVLSVDGSEKGHRIHLGSTRYITNGWSGSPLIDPRTKTVVGVLTLLYLNQSRGRTVSRTAAGTNLATIESFLLRHGLTESVWESPTVIPAVEDAPKAFALAVQHIEELINLKVLKALDSLEQLLVLRPDSPVVHRLLAYSTQGLAKGGKNQDKDYLAQAEMYFRKAMDLDPNDPRSKVAYGVLLRQSGRYSEALVQTEAALALNPDNELALVNRLDILAKTDPNRWFLEAKDLVERDPNHPHYWFVYSTAMRSNRMYQDAVTAAQKAVGLDPNSLYWGELARAQVGIGDLKRAEVNFERMTRECGCQQCWTEYADFLIDHRPGDPNALKIAEQAVVKVEQAKAIRISVANQRVLRIKLNMARVNLLAKSSVNDAERLARQWIDHDPNEGHYWWTLADLLRTQSRLNDAVDAAQKAVDIDPNGTFNFQPRLANCLAKAGRFKEAEKTYQQMLKDHPDRALYWFWYAEFLVDCQYGRIDQLRQALDKASDPNAPWPVEVNDLTSLRLRIGQGGHAE